MIESRGSLRSQTEIGSGKETKIGKESGTETETGMTEGTETEESSGETTWHRTVRAKEVMFTPVSDDKHFHSDAFFYVNGRYIFILLSGRKDDEMDPMDPSAYSDAPRYGMVFIVKMSK